jgi:serine/threonine-protein kinase RsbW
VDTLTLTATLESLKPIADYVMTAAKSAGLDKKATYRLRLAVDEIATNAIRHGHAEAKQEGIITIYHEIKGGNLKIILEDTGVPYDPRQTPPPDDLDLPLEERDIGGLGIYLTMYSVDEFHYEYTGNRNRNTFVMYLNKPFDKD